MITTEKLKTIPTVTPATLHQNWSFLPLILSAFAGVGIGVVIGNYLGWL